MIEFQPFDKIPRLSRDCVVTEKIDGTNASILIVDIKDVDIDDFGDKYVAAVGTKLVFAGSRTRWITPEDDNFRFAAWVKEHAIELSDLGYGHHFGEWWGSGVQRGYGLDHRRFSLFNTGRWNDPANVLPKCCHVVPVLYEGVFDTNKIDGALFMLNLKGSEAAPNFMRPEGIVVYHKAANQLFKKTIEVDHEAKTVMEKREKSPRSPRATPLEISILRATPGLTLSQLRDANAAELQIALNHA